MGKRILVVDYDDATISALEGALENVGLTAVTARDRDEAIIECQADLPAAVLLAIDLGGERHRDVVQAVRAQQNGAMVPILFMGTGRSDERIRSPSDALAHGGDYYFRLPADLDYLAGRVLSWTERPKPMPKDEGESLEEAPEVKPSPEGALELEAFNLLPRDQEAAQHLSIPAIERLRAPEPKPRQLSSDDSEPLDEEEWGWVATLEEPEAEQAAAPETLEHLAKVNQLAEELPEAEPSFIDEQDDLVAAIMKAQGQIVLGEKTPKEEEPTPETTEDLPKIQAVAKVEEEDDIPISVVEEIIEAAPEEPAARVEKVVAQAPEPETTISVEPAQIAPVSQAKVSPPAEEPAPVVAEVSAPVQAPPSAQVISFPKVESPLAAPAAAVEAQPATISLLAARAKTETKAPKLSSNALRALEALIQDPARARAPAPPPAKPISPAYLGAMPQAPIEEEDTQEMFSPPILAATGGKDFPPGALDCVHQAESLRLAGNLRGAVQSYALAAQLYRDHHLYEAAEALYKQILKLDPSHVATRSRLESLNQESEARRLLKEKLAEPLAGSETIPAPRPTRKRSEDREFVLEFEDEMDQVDQLEFVEDMSQLTFEETPQRTPKGATQEVPGTISEPPKEAPQEVIAQAQPEIEAPENEAERTQEISSEQISSFINSSLAELSTSVPSNPLESLQQEQVPTIDERLRDHLDSLPKLEKNRIPLPSPTADLVIDAPEEMYAIQRASAHRAQNQEIARWLDNANETPAPLPWGSHIPGEESSLVQRFQSAPPTVDMESRPVPTTSDLCLPLPEPAQDVAEQTSLQQWLSEIGESVVSHRPRPMESRSLDPSEISEDLKLPVRGLSSEQDQPILGALRTTPLQPRRGVIHNVVDVVSLLVRAKTQRSTGLLCFEGLAPVAMAHGEPAALRGETATRTLVELLLANGKLTRDQAEYIIQEGHVCPRTMAEQLTGRLQLRSGEAEIYLHRHLEDHVTQMLRHRGTWIFETSSTPIRSQELIAGTPSVRDLLIDLLPRACEAQELLSHLGGGRIHLNLISTGEQPRHQRDARFISLLDGHCSIEEAIELSGIHPARGASIGLVWVLSGWTEVVAPQPKLPQPSPSQSPTRIPPPASIRPQSVLSQDPLAEDTRGITIGRQSGTKLRLNSTSTRWRHQGARTPPASPQRPQHIKELAQANMESAVNAQPTTIQNPTPSFGPQAKANAQMRRQELAELDEASRVRLMAEMVRSNDYFTILDIDADASRNTIDEAHQNLRQLIPPEHFSEDPDLIRMAREVLRSVDEARDVLMVPELRAAYEHHLKP